MAYIIKINTYFISFVEYVLSLNIGKDEAVKRDIELIRRLFFEKDKMFLFLSNLDAINLLSDTYLNDNANKVIRFY